MVVCACYEQTATALTRISTCTRLWYREQPAMLSTLRPPKISSSLRSLQRVRSLATERPLPKSFADTTAGLPPLPTVKRKENPEGPLRPHLQVPVNPNHGLWAFFRKKLDKDGNATYETIEPRKSNSDYSGASLSGLCSRFLIKWLARTCMDRS
jgi:hypothetical protein